MASVSSAKDYFAFFFFFFFSLSGPAVIWLLSYLSSKFSRLWPRFLLIPMDLNNYFLQIPSNALYTTNSNVLCDFLFHWYYSKVLWNYQSLFIRTYNIRSHLRFNLIQCFKQIDDLEISCGLVVSDQQGPCVHMAEMNVRKWWGSTFKWK